MRVHATIRARVPTLEHDRPPSPDIATIAAMIDARRTRTRVRDESQLKFFFENRLTSVARDS